MKMKNIADFRSTNINPFGSNIVFVSGVTGQDGSHMIDYLLKNTNAEIVGGARRLSVENHTNIKHLENEPRFQLINFDLTDPHSIYKLMETVRPDYFINFAAQSFVASSWDFARQTWQTNSTAVLDCLEAIKKVKPSCRFYNAGSSEEFGNVSYSPQDENHPAKPRSPYGASKSAARTIVKVYRESYGLYAVQGWLFNHEGTRRGEEFVTRKITKGVARIKKALDEGKSFNPIELGNLNAQRDWSDAEDMVDAVWRMLNQENYNVELNEKVSLNTDPNGYYTPSSYNQFIRNNIVPLIKDYVVSSGENHSIHEFVEESFAAAFGGSLKYNQLNVTWSDTLEPINEKLYLEAEDGLPTNDRILVQVNPKFYRPAEVETLLGDSTKIREELGWAPKSSFKDLVKKMIDNDLK